MKHQTFLQKIGKKFICHQLFCRYYNIKKYLVKRYIVYTDFDFVLN